MTRHWPTLLGSLVRVDDIRRAISEAYRVRDETVGLLSPSLELPLEFDCQNQFNLQHVVGCGALFPNQSCTLYFLPTTSRAIIWSYGQFGDLTPTRSWECCHRWLRNRSDCDPRQCFPGAM